MLFSSHVAIRLCSDESSVASPQPATPLSVTSNASDALNVSFLCDPLERVVWTSPTQPLLMTYHETTQRHTLWSMRQSKRQLMKRVRAAYNAAGSSLPRSE